MKYQPLRNFLLLLAHPVSILAMVVLFVNDHILRIYWPSWWTGKIGDFAWLFFAPFAFAALIALLFPNRPRLEKLIGITAFGLVGIVFILAKTISAFNTLLVYYSSLLFGSAIKITLDSSDLIALLALALAFRFWIRYRKIQMAFSRRAWVVLPLAALLTIANSGAPDYGIDCLVNNDQRIVAFSGVYSYVTLDGGLSWTGFLYSGAPECSQNSPESTIPDPNQPNILYRFSPGRNIEKSSDEGKTWQTEYDISSGNPAKRAYYEKALRDTSIGLLTGPLDAIIDPGTGNVIFAMGDEGVLVREADGNWVWVAIGYHQRIEISKLAGLYSLLSGELWLAFSLGALLLFNWAVILRRSCLKEVLLGLFWIIWLLMFFLLPSTSGEYYGLSIFDIFLLISSLMLALLSLSMIWKSIGSARLGIFQLIGQALLGTILFFLPYLLWYMGILSNYNIAIAFALAFSIASLLMGIYSINKLSKIAQQPQANSSAEQ